MSTATLSRLPGFFTVTATAQETLGRKRSLQAERRRADLWTDQHGREWAAEMDLKTGHPCTPLRPLGWTAPILPPPMFMEFGTGRGRPITTINYAKWIEHQGALQAEHEANVRDIASRMFPNSWAREIQANNPLLVQEAGRPPYAVEFVQACAEGNRWALGLSAKRPGWVTDALFATIPVPQRFAPVVSRVTDFYDADEDEGEVIADRISASLAYDDDDEPVAPRRRGRPRKDALPLEDAA